MFGDVQTAAKLMVKVGADVQEAQSKLKGMSRDFDALKSAGTKMAMGVTVAVAAVGAATVAFANKAIQAGSDLEESQNKARVVFGESAAAIEQWSKGSAQALAMTQQQALEASATFGNLFTSMGLAIQPATEMSQGLVQLAADLASFNNLNVDEALLKLQSGLVGETEPLRALGVNLSAAATQAEALRMGLAANVDALTAADLAQARYALILQQTTAAQGDLARTSDGWANQNRILQATLANMTAEIGTQLLPVVNSFLQQLVDFVQNSGPSIVATVGTIVTSFQSMVTAIGQVDLSVVTAQFEGLKQSIGVDFWAEVFGFIGKQIALTVTNFQELGFELSSIGEQFKAFGEFLKGDTSWSEYRERMKELQVEYDNVHAAFQKTYDEINGKDWGETISALDAVSRANQEATDWWQRHSESFSAVSEANQVATDWWLQLADNLSIVNQQSIANLQELNKLAEAEDTLNATTLTAVEYWDQYVGSLSGVVELNQAAVEGWQRHNEELRALNETTLTAVEYWDQYVGSLSGVAELNQAATDWWQRHNEELRALNETTLTAVEYWDQYVGSLSGVVELNQAAVEGWQRHIEELRALNETTLTAVEYWDQYVGSLSGVVELNQAAVEGWQRHSEALRAVNDDTSAASGALVSLADVWTQAYQAIQDATVTGMDNSRLKVLQTFNGMAQDYANYATTIVDLEDRKGQMVAYLESVYQQQAAALQAAGQTAQLADLTRAHNAKLQAVLASYNTQIKLEKSGQTALLSNAKTYYLTTLSMMAKALIAQVAVVKANMMAMVRMIVSGYGSAAAAALAFNKIKEGMSDIGAINAAMNEVMSAFNAIEGAGIGAITEASQAFQDWQSDIGGVADGLSGVADGLGDIGSSAGGVQERLTDPLKAAADVVSQIGTMIQKAIEAFNTLAKWGGPQAGWVEKFNLLAAALVQMVQRWAAAVQQIMPLLEEDKRNSIMQFAEMVRGVMAALQAAVTVLSALEGYEGVFAVSAEALTNILGFVRDMATRFAEIAKAFKDEVMTAVKAFSETASVVIKAVGDAANVLLQLEDFDANVGEDVVDQIVVMTKYLVKAFGDIADDFSDLVLNDVKKFADGAGAVLKLIGDAVGALAKLSEYTSPSRFRDLVGRLLEQIRYLVATFGIVADLVDSDLRKEAEKFAAAVGPVVKAVSDAIGALMKMREWWSATRFRDLVGRMLEQIRYLVATFGIVGGLVDKDLLKAAEKFAAAVGPVTKAVGDAVGGLMKMREWWAVSRFRDLIGRMLEQIRYLVATFGVVAGQVDGALLAEAQRFAAAVGPVTKAVGDAIGGLMKFVDYDKNLNLANAGAENLVQQIGAFVRKMARMAGQLGGPTLEAAKSFAAAAGPVVNLIGDAIDGFMKFKDYDKNLNLANAGADNLVQQIGAFVRKLARLGDQLGGPALEAAKSFAVTAAPVVSLIGDAIEAFMKFKDYDKNLNLANAGAEQLTQQIGSFVRKLARLGQQIGQPALAAAEYFAEAASKVLSTISEALDLLTKIKTYVSPSANALLAFERDVEDMLLRFTRWVVFVIQPIAGSIDREAMMAMEDMVNALAAALELLNGLVDYVAPSAASLSAFMDGVQQLAEDFYEWAQTNGPQLFKEIPPEFLAAFRDVFEGLSAAVDVLTALVDFVAPSVIAVMQFEEGYQRLFMDWLTWVQNNFSQTKNELLIAIAAVFSQVMDGLRTAVEVLTALIDFIPPSAFAVMTFEEGYQRLFRDWVTWATGTFEDLNTELVAAVASVFGNVFDGIGAAVATLTALSGYVSPGLAAITAFEDDYQRLFTGFVNWVETTFTDISTDVVVAMTGAASALFQGLGAAATTLNQITGYVGPTETTISRFEDDYQRIATGFANWAESTWTEEMAATTTAVGNAVNALYQGLGTAVTTLSLIRNYTPASQAVIDRFIADMTNVMGTMLAWVETSFGVDAQAIMTSFGNTTQALFSGLGTALNVLQGIAQYTVPDSQFVLALQRFNDNLLTAITSWQIWLTNTFTPETAALVQQFHTILSGIVADMRAALELLMDIDQASLPTADDLIAFLDAVAALFDGVIDLFGGVTGEITQLVGAMANAFQEIFDTIEAAVDDFGGTLYAGLGQLFSTLAGQMWAWGDYAAGMFMSGLLAGMQNINSQNAVIEAMRDLAEQLEAELRAAWGIGSPSKVAERLGGFFVSGLARGLEDLDQIPAMIQRSLAMDGVTLGADVRYSPAPRHDYLTVAFEGAWQTGMSPAEEKRITSAMVGELRRQGLALQVARV